MFVRLPPHCCPAANCTAQPGAPPSLLVGMARTAGYAAADAASASAAVAVSSWIGCAVPVGSRETTAAARAPGIAGADGKRGMSWCCLVGWVVARCSIAVGSVGCAAAGLLAVVAPRQLRGAWAPPFTLRTRAHPLLPRIGPAPAAPAQPPGPGAVPQASFAAPLEILVGW